MPELPEVEVVRLGLAEHVTGRTVAAVEVRHPRSIRRHLAGELDFTARLCGRQICAARRRGKYLWLELAPLTGLATAGEAVLAHLGMSGQMRIQLPGAPDETHLRVRLQFSDGGPELRFIDQRTFGGLSVEEVAGGLPIPISHIARDPMDPFFDRDAVVAGIQRRCTGLKRALLDQTLVSGIGNIYADEALFRAGIHPLRPAGRLSAADWERVRDGIEQALSAGIEAKGASIDDFRHLDGARGSFQDLFLVHRRAGEPCPNCGTTIRKIVVGGRGTYVCENCQRKPRARRASAGRRR